MARRTPALLVALCAFFGSAPSSASQDELTYCRPSATALDPVDVPPEGSAAPEVPGVRERKVRANGVRTRLLVAGPRRSRTAVVFLHGSPGSSADFANLLPRVATRGARAVAFDLPGFGHADEAWGADPTLDAGVEALSDVLHRMNVRDVHLVAHDIGGPIGLEWGARHPRRLRSATLIDTGLLLGYHHHSLAQLTRTPGAGEGFWATLNRESFGAGIQYGQTRPLPAEFVNRLYDDLDRETRCAIIGLYRGTDDSEVREFARRQAKALVRRRRRPALVLWGADDPYLPAEMAHRQREGFPHAKIHIFEDAAHWPFIDFPRRSSKLIVRFVRRAVDTDRR